MNLFSLFSKITLDKTDYTRNLKAASTLTKQEANNMKNSLLEMQKTNERALQAVTKDFANGRITLSQYNEKLAEINRSQKEISQAAETSGVKLQKSATKAKAGWAALVAIIMKAVQAMKRLVTESMDYADQIGDLAAKYGVTTDAISEMQYIADQSSTSIDGLTNSMKILYSRAKQDGEAFKQLGVSVRDADGEFKSMDEVFWETVGALNDIDSEGEKSAYMLELFGRNAMEVGEVLRKDTEEIKRMRQEAHDLGIVVSEGTIKFASDFNDTIAVLKLQMKSTVASMVAGAEDAEQRFDDFCQHLLDVADRYVPAFAEFLVRFLHVLGTRFMSVAPTIIADIIAAMIEAIFETDWFNVGADLALSIMEGFANTFGTLFNKMFGWLGLKIPKIDIGVDKYYGQTSAEGLYNLATGKRSYSLNENKQEITVKVEATGDTEMSKENAQKTADALAPYIDRILGDK